MKRIILLGAIFCLTFLSAYAATHTSPGGKWVLTTGSSATITISQSGRTLINGSRTAFRNATAVANPGGTNISTMNNISGETNVAWSDEFGTGMKVTITGSATGGGASGVTITQDYYFYDDQSYFLTEFRITSSSSMNCNYMAPIYISGANNQLTFASPNASGNRTLEVPYHNDGHVRYWVTAFSSNTTTTTRNSYEVGAAFNESSYNGLVIGSVEHTTWKTGVDIGTRSNNNLYAMEVYGGRAMGLGTSSARMSGTQIHGPLNGTNIKSPKIFVGWFSDWRDGMETYAAVNEKIAPKLEYYGRKPFGWNSWGHIGGDLNWDNATESANWIHDVIQTHVDPTRRFINDNTLYIGLDSFQDWVMSGNQRASFPYYVGNRNGQKAGTYGGSYYTFNGPSDGVANTGYTFDQLYLKYNGNRQNYDGDNKYCLDPTHPGTKKLVEQQLHQALFQGHRYIKLDYMAHGSVETGATPAFYLSNQANADAENNGERITTGAQAYHYALKHINTYLKNHPLYPKDDDFYINLSIAPAFPANLAHSRRISCDAYNSRNYVAYILNSLMGGWWLDRAGYYWNDGDHITAVNNDKSLQSENLTKSRVTAGVIIGMFLSGDHFGNTPVGTNNLTTIKNRMGVSPGLLINADVNELARHCKSFRPVTTGSVTTSGDPCPIPSQFMTTLKGVGGEDITYVAAFNITSSNVTGQTLNWANLKLSGSYNIKELWTGTTTNNVSSFSIGTINSDECRLYKIWPVGTTGELAPLPVTNRPTPPVTPPVVIPGPAGAISQPIASAAPSPNWEIIKDGTNGLPLTERGRMIWGDYNNDGHLDAFILSQANHWLFKNNGDNTFTETTVTLPQEMKLYPMRKGSALFLDYNNDGNIDIITMGVGDTHGLGHNEAIMLAWKNSGAPDYTFSLDWENVVKLQGGRASDDAQGRILQAVDFDHDGWSDLIAIGELTANGGNPSNRFVAYFKNNQGVFQRVRTMINGYEFTFQSSGTVNIGDVNGDGYADIITTGWFDSNSYNPKCCWDQSLLYINNKNDSFTFSSYTGTQGGEHMEVAFGDLNGDGYDDIVDLGWGDGAIHISGGNGTSFTRNVIGNTKDNTTISVGDVNNDGYLDILIGGSGDPNAWILYGNGTGTSFTKVDLPNQLRARTGANCLVDIDGDGNLDVAAFGYGDGYGWVSAFGLNKLGNGAVQNTPPTIPDNFNITFSGGKYQLTWNKSTDAQTSQSAIRYNVYARSYDTGLIYSYAPADVQTGKLKIQDGLVSLVSTNSFVWSLPEGNYTFGVSAVDQANMASKFNLKNYPVESVTWTGAIDTDWEKKGNWTPAIVPDFMIKTTIPAGKTNYPILKGDESVKTLFMAKGATIELSDYTLSAIEGITVQTFMDSKKWYSISFPFDIETVYSVEFDSDLTPWSHFWLKEYNSSTQQFDQTMYINEMGGYILQLPTGYANGTEIHYISGPVNGLTKKNLIYQNDTYILQANPTLGPVAIDGAALALTDQYIYQLDLAVSPDYLLIKGNTTIAPFEAIATFKKNMASPAPKISLGENEQTDIDNGSVAPPDVILSKTLYNMQGQAIEKPQKGSVYIEKTIFQSGRTKVVKQIK